MAAGVLRASSRNFNVADNTCFEAIVSIAKVRPAYNSAVCSSDPVIVGTNITFVYPVAPANVVYSVSSVTATSPQAVDLGSRPGDWATTPFLLQAVLVVAAVFILFAGYRAGDKL